jgi:uncharacterized protein YprB with RNaseH-like and TPR domain
MENTKAKVLFWDIESSDLSADIGHIISIGYKWGHEAKVHVMSLLDYPGKVANDDSKLIAAFLKVYDEADLVVHHFGEFFDLPFLRTRMLIHGMKPLPDTAQVDTWRIAKKRFKFGSNRLQRILEVLRCPYDKSPVKLSVWGAARVGDPKAIKYVIEHNRLDVLVLEWVYKRLAPSWQHHPALHISENGECTYCGGKTVSKGRRLCVTHWYQRRFCTKCGKYLRGRKLT